MDHDRKFFDTFMLVLGALMAFTVAVYFLANAIAETNLDIQNKENPLAQRELDKRLAPVGNVKVAGQTSPATQAAPLTMVAAAPQPAAAAPAVAKKIDGQVIYQQACFACHGTGAAGAPKLGDKADWGPRIAQGMATLKKHALEGFTGKKGMMPPKGGFTHLKDEEVVAALEYMLAQSK